MSTYIHHEIFLLIQSVFTGAILFFVMIFSKHCAKYSPTVPGPFPWKMCFTGYCALFLFLQGFTEEIREFFVFLSSAEF